MRRQLVTTTHNVRFTTRASRQQPERGSEQQRRRRLSAAAKEEKGRRCSGVGAGVVETLSACVVVSTCLDVHGRNLHVLRMQLVFALFV